jgi:two-component system, OmpR family, phosphate regulon sensor histidine kinase PhoR
VTRLSTPRRLRLLLGTLFIALALPSALLVWRTERQIQLEAWHQQREAAEALTSAIDARLQQLIRREEARGYGDYRYLTVAGDPSRGILSQRSPLAVMPGESDTPGLLGHFQVDPRGVFSTPLLPEAASALGMDEAEWQARLTLRARLAETLVKNSLLPRDSSVLPERPARVGAELLEAAAEPPASQAAFDRLNVVPSRASSAPEAPRPAAASAESSKQQELRGVRRERSAILESAPAPSIDADAAGAVSPEANSAERDLPPVSRIGIFESVLDPFEFSRLESGHFVLFRRVWNEGGRSIQGLILDGDAFLGSQLLAPFRASTLAPATTLAVSWRGTEIARASAQGPLDNPLHQLRLSAPFGDVQLAFALNRLEPGPGAMLARWTGVVLLAVLLLGFYALYRLGLGQLRLARQQQEFVAAVSHELKTPLTSIRMYGELLREGWVPEEKRREYYVYIHEESERLSRLISNILQLARMEREELAMELRPASVSELFDLLRSRLSGQIERAGFEATFDLEPGLGARRVEVDNDALLQIFINLVDNALKFSARAEHKAVAVAARAEGNSTAVFSVRDHGPGVPRAHLRRIFELFYRGGDAMAGETVGTGIGLALVRQLAVAMGGSVEVVNREPGVEFRVHLPLLDETAAHPRR